MKEVSKTYGNGQKLIIYDDETSPKEVLRAKLIKTFTASDGEQYEQTLVEGTETDLTSELERINADLAALQARKTQITARKAALRTELDKLPQRAKAEVIE